MRPAQRWPPSEVASVTEPLVIVGVGGFGREVLDVIDRINRVELVWQVVGVADDYPSGVNLDRLSARGVTYVGAATSQALAALDVRKVAVCVGDPNARSELFRRLETAGYEFATLVDPLAILGSECIVEGGTIICGAASIGTNVRLARGVHINPNATIGHDTQLDEFVSVNPSANVSGDCTIGPRTLIGASAVVLQGIEVGADATVGAGAVVVRDVDSGQTVKGVPAR